MEFLDHNGRAFPNHNMKSIDVKQKTPHGEILPIRKMCKQKLLS